MFVPGPTVEPPSSVAATGSRGTVDHPRGARRRRRAVRPPAAAASCRTKALGDPDRPGPLPPAVIASTCRPDPGTGRNWHTGSARRTPRRPQGSGCATRRIIPRNASRNLPQSRSPEHGSEPGVKTRRWTSPGSSPGSVRSRAEAAEGAKALQMESAATSGWVLGRREACLVSDMTQSAPGCARAGRSPAFLFLSDRCRARPAGEAGPGRCSAAGQMVPHRHDGGPHGRRAVSRHSRCATPGCVS